MVVIAIAEQGQVAGNALFHPAAGSRVATTHPAPLPRSPPAATSTAQKYGTCGIDHSGRGSRLSVTMVDSLGLLVWGSPARVAANATADLRACRPSATRQHEET
jgi:hypothetical protein